MAGIPGGKLWYLTYEPPPCLPNSPTLPLPDPHRLHFFSSPLPTPTPRPDVLFKPAFPSPKLLSLFSFVTANKGVGARRGIKWGSKRGRCDAKERWSSFLCLGSQEAWEQVHGIFALGCLGNVRCHIGCFLTREWDSGGLGGGYCSFRRRGGGFARITAF